MGSTAIVGAWAISGFGESDERVPLTHGYRLCCRRHAAHLPARLRTGKGESHFDFAVAGERLGPREVHGAPVGLELVATLSAALEGTTHPVSVPDDEITGVDQNPAVGFGRHGEAPQNADGKRLLHREPFVRIVGFGPVGIVGLHQEHPGANALEADDALSTQLPTIQPDVIGPDTSGEGHGIDQLLLQDRDLEPHFSGSSVPVERQETVQSGHPLGLVGDRGYGILPVERPGVDGHEREAKEQRCAKHAHSLRLDWRGLVNGR